MRRRITELTEHQREVIDQARKILSPFFPGEEVRLYVPEKTDDDRMRRDMRIAEMLSSGLSAPEISRAVDMSIRHVRLVRGRIGIKRGNIPP